MIDAKTFRLDGRLALVTGSSAGIGLAVARGLAEAGAAVVLNGRDGGRLEAAAGTLRAEGHRVHMARFDTCDAGAVQGEVARIEADSRFFPSRILLHQICVSGGGQGVR